jgi:hypothetical protein
LKIVLLSVDSFPKIDLEINAVARTSGFGSNRLGPLMVGSTDSNNA